MGEHIGLFWIEVWYGYANFIIPHNIKFNPAGYSCACQQHNNPLFSCLKSDLRFKRSFEILRNQYKIQVCYYVDIKNVIW